MLSAVLDGYENARLNREIVKNQRLANEINVGYDMISRGPQLFQISGVVAKGKTNAQLELGVRNAIQRIVKDGILESELRRIKVRLLSDQIYKRDSVFGQAMEIGSTEMAGISWRKIDKILEEIQRVTPEQVCAVAKKYLVDSGLTIVTLDPQARKNTK